MTQHLFLFTPGIWLGQGEITFNHSPDRLVYYTRWRIQPLGDNGDGIRCHQEVQIPGVEGTRITHMTIVPGEGGFFLIRVESEQLGSLIGEGQVEAETISWRIITSSGDEGYECYTLEDADHYRLEAEYRSPLEGYCTNIRGKIHLTDE